MDSLRKERNNNSKEIGRLQKNCKGQQNAFREWLTDRRPCRRSPGHPRGTNPVPPCWPTVIPGLSLQNNRKPLMNIK